MACCVWCHGEGQGADVGRKGFGVSGSADRRKLLKIKEFTALDDGFRG
jgi:hypothetical protein